MLTGDKIETATCIAVSAGFKNPHEKMYFIKELEHLRDAETMLKEFENKASNNLLMIDG